MSDTAEATILLTEEDDTTRAFLHTNLRADGYQVLVAPDRVKARTLELLDTVRAGEGVAGRADPDTPMIVLSRDADRLQRIRLLGRGGDAASPHTSEYVAAPQNRQRCERNGLRVSPGRRRTSALVLLQHFHGNLDNWDPAPVDALARAPRVVTFDNAGVGGSTGATPSTIAQMARDAIALLPDSGSDVCWCKTIGRLARSDLRAGRQHPALTDHGCRRSSGPGWLRHRLS